MQYLELHKKHSNVDGAVKATGINTIVKRRKQLIQEILRTFIMTSLLG